MFINISVKNTDLSSFRMERGEEPLSILINYVLCKITLFSFNDC